ncbi:antitoxin ParD1/3/4 [Rhizobium sp. PP-F2F-G38]|nr:antitoxin ParD1/3/4 [Rhizobium sp. PP-WC-1G-195]PYF00501.1 antitoxin ParD1/3/4 [Rhizobium sp. PP-F2F-G38]
MTSHTITLTGPIANLLDRQMNANGYGSVSEYIADLVARDAATQETATAELRGMLESAKQSGTSSRDLDEILREARSRRSK